MDKFFYNQNKLIKIIHFPHTTNLLNLKKSKIKFKKKIKNRFLLLSNSYDVKHFHDKFLDSNIIDSQYIHNRTNHLGLLRDDDF